MKVEVIRTTGAKESHEITGRAFDSIYKLIGASCCDSVNLRNGMVMLVDDTGLIDGKPLNPEATKLYHSVCVRGTTHPICGDVAIVRDADFA